MYNAHYQRGRIHTNEHSLLFLSWGKEIYQISIVPKQTQINAFYNYVCKLLVCGCKGTIKFAGVQEKSHFLVFFYSERYCRALDCQEGRKDTQRDTRSGKTITEIPEYDSGLMNKDCIEYSTLSRGNRRIFTRRTNVEHLTGRKVRGKY